MHFQTSKNILLLKSGPYNFATFPFNLQKKIKRMFGQVPDSSSSIKKIFTNENFLDLVFLFSLLIHTITENAEFWSFEWNQPERLDGAWETK